MQELFSNELLSAYLGRFKINLEREIESAKPEYLLNIEEEAYSNFLVSKYTVSRPILKEQYIDKEELERTSRPTVYNPSMFSGDLVVTISIPFEGERHLFKCRPLGYKKNPIAPPIGNITGSEIKLSYIVTRSDAKSIKEKYTQDINKIHKYLQWIKEDLDSHNEWIKNNVNKMISERKEKLLSDQTFLESFGLPIKRSKNVPETYTFPEVRKKIKASKPNLKDNFQQKTEPVLAFNDYELILETIWHMSIAMERSPKTFSKLSEPEIRDFFVILLNSHYEGGASGETFNYSGKADILVRVEDKNIFIAECKFWRGKKHFLSTIDQILRYTSWRDTKTAIFLFNKKKDFSKILVKIQEAVLSHKFYKRKNELKNERIRCDTIFSYVFKHPVDAKRELFLSVLAFNIPSEVT